MKARLATECSWLRWCSVARSIAVTNTHAHAYRCTVIHKTLVFIILNIWSYIKYKRPLRTIFTAQRSYASAVFRVVILSVRPSVCHTRALWQNQTMYCGYFDTTRKRNHRSFLAPTVVGGWRPLPSEICVESDPPSFEKRRLRPISAYNVSTVRDSENVQLWRIGSRQRAFQWAIGGEHMLPSSFQRVAQKPI